MDVLQFKNKELKYVLPSNKELESPVMHIYDGKFKKELPLIYSPEHFCFLDNPFFDSEVWKNAIYTFDGIIFGASIYILQEAKIISARNLMSLSSVLQNNFHLAPIKECDLLLISEDILNKVSPLGNLEVISITEGLLEIKVKE